MTIPILPEPRPTGFRATTGGPLELSADAASAELALMALQSQIDGRFEQGAMLIERPVPAPKSPILLMPLAENPLLGRWLDEVEKYREEKEFQDRTAYGDED